MKAALSAAREATRAAHDSGLPGDETAREYTAAVDEILKGLLTKVGLPPSVAVVAVGGFGRGELLPFSDLDVWFVVEDSADPKVSSFAEEVLYPLWDSKLDVGHAVRTVEETLALAPEDLTCATALLDARLLAGDETRWQALKAAAPRAFADSRPFIDKLRGERAERHKRFGDTVYLLEPNTKNGDGGSRDLLAGLWAVKARFGVDDFPALVPSEAAERQAQALVEARRFSLTVRTACHLAAGRKADRLTFELQESIAPSFAARFGKRFGLSPTPSAHPAVAPAVEALMQRYFLAAKAVRRETERLFDRCVRVPSRKKPRRIDDSFTVVDGRLVAAALDKPRDLVRAFNVAVELGADLDGATRDLIADQAARRGADLGADSEAQRELARLIADDRDARQPSRLEEAHDLGVLDALMPEFAACAARVQHDLYHVYTVDQHQLYALARLKALARGELADELPLPTEALADVERRGPLYLATLLHDVGKPLGKGHSESGAKLTATVAARLGFSPDEIAEAEFLVRKHLLLARLSQRRDLNDNAMIANLAAELRDAETLRALYVLTVCDMSMVAPDNLSQWKEELLGELYRRTLEQFEGNAEVGGEDLVDRRRARAAELLGEKPEQLAAWTASMPARYFAVTAPNQIAHHVALSRRRNGPVAVEVAQHVRRNMTELTVIADDAPGLLSRIAGVLLANRIDVWSAQIYSRGPEVVDVFSTRDRYGRAITDDKRWARVEDDLREVLGGSVEVAALIESRREKSPLPERVVPAVTTEIDVDNDISAELSVVDVYTQDRLGVLYTITNTLAAQHLDIHIAKVATEGHRVADAFYVLDADGKKLSSVRVAELRAELTKALS
jgi:[protein-PII] uridylyltransferase